MSSSSIAWNSKIKTKISLIPLCSGSWDRRRAKRQLFLVHSIIIDKLYFSCSLSEKVSDFSHFIHLQLRDTSQTDQLILNDLLETMIDRWNILWYLIWILKAGVSEEILKWHSDSLSLSAELWIIFLLLACLSRPSQYKLMQRSALRLWLFIDNASSESFQIHTL